MNQLQTSQEVNCLKKNPFNFLYCQEINASSFIFCYQEIVNFKGFYFFLQDSQGKYSQQYALLDLLIPFYESNNLKGSVNLINLDAPALKEFRFINFHLFIYAQNYFHLKERE
ncbi:hypothetical protein TTHERM_000095509 (macronuclear) [Tetrahymena thermophila SB210]|uniref:Uncharacterized protein n=1 Tax=Tetrahymena thermophila (strain SB210) TaxID=312017 RepID=W7XKY9_TETTS|nr:hypothetical protein TTHERM_000095509 [Tetrahymena thermophila SB210]EWS75369.1 hypothetical protein TTHERM_000095509 [Tetrahymena thermophila SB210]|eukprot:XP_012652043.1 hypothetical protein TTHERM_000095509 [Tetrahymena thermophila SB210]